MQMVMESYQTFFFLHFLDSPAPRRWRQEASALKTDVKRQEPQTGQPSISDDKLLGESADGTQPVIEKEVHDAMMVLVCKRP